MSARLEQRASRRPAASCAERVRPRPAAACRPSRGAASTSSTGPDSTTRRRASPDAARDARTRCRSWLTKIIAMPSSAAGREQLENVRLNGHVERGGRLVGDQQRGPVGDRHRDHRPLPFAARELMRIGARRASGRWRCRPVRSGRRRAGAPRRAIRRACASIGAAIWSPIGVERIERGHRLLEDHRHRRAAEPVEPSRSARRSVPRPRSGPNPLARPLRGSSPSVGEQSLRLARAGLADDCDDLAGRDVEIDALHRLDAPPAQRIRP